MIEGSHTRFRALAAVSTAVTVLILAIASPAVAGAADPSSAQYGSPTSQIAGEVGSGGSGGGPAAAPASGTAAPAPTAGEESRSSSGLESKPVGGLPFTGLDLIALAAVAMALALLGFALRRFTADSTRLPD